MRLLSLTPSDLCRMTAFQGPHVLTESAWKWHDHIFIGHGVGDMGRKERIVRHSEAELNGRMEPL